MRRRSCAAVFAIFVVIFSFAVVARADETDTRALALFEQSERAYDQGKFSEAIQLLDQAWALKKEPVLLYNMGRAYEGAGDQSKAADKYEEFLRLSPDAPDRGALQKRIANLRRDVAERAALAKQAREREAADKQREQERGAGVVPWIVSGVGVAGVGTGVVFGILSSKKHSDAVDDPTYAGADSKQSSAKTFATVANVCLIAGAVLIVGGVVWALLDR
jgi:tetratricopeptide (TPR) repeat protein